MNLCKNCGNETPNAKFCSRSCSAKVTNKETPKRKPEHKCQTCPTMVNCRNRYCTECRKNKRKHITLGEAIYHRHHVSSAYALVRTRARAIARKLGWHCCSKCPYDKHVEIAHIIPIGDFPLDTPISVINDVANLMPLCPNCHWEFDNLK